MLREERKSVENHIVLGLLGHRNRLPWFQLPLYLFQIRLRILHRLALHIYRSHLRSNTHLHVGHYIEEVYDARKTLLLVCRLLFELPRSRRAPILPP